MGHLDGDALSVGSAFSGIGGFDLGLQRAGMRIAWQCESDPWCRRILERHWPAVPRHPDIRTIGAADLEPVDVICGGFPCQDLSVAGGGTGLDGARSGLWSELARLTDELRPRYLIMENVTALLARGLGRILGELAALGYDAEWDCIPACALGAPHQRDRIWIVAYPGSQRIRLEPERDQRQGRPLRAPQRRDALAPHDGAPGTAPGEDPDPDRQRQQGPLAEPAARGLAEPGGDGRCVYCGEPTGTGYDEHEQCVERSCAEAVADPESGALGTGLRPDRPPTEGRRRRRPLNGSQPPRTNPWATEPDVGRVADGVPRRVDRLKGLGNALVPQIAEWIGRRIVEHEQESR